MSRYIVSPAAADDIDEILLYLSEEAGETIVFQTEDDLIHAFEFLGQNPALGHRRTDLTDRPGVRFFLVKPYLVIYQSDREPIVIHAVLHASRDVPRPFSKRSF